MASYFFKSSEIKFVDHPIYEGVQVAKLIPKEAGQPVGVLMLKIAPSVEIPIHTHDINADSIFVVSGNGLVFVNGKWEEVGAGDYILAPAGEEHGVRNQGNEPLVLFIHHSPPLM